MERLRRLAPWQIIAIAIAVLAVLVVAGYFLVTASTTPAENKAQGSNIPTNLDSKANQDVLGKLRSFKQPSSVPQAAPLRTPDPNNPNTGQNPFVH